MSTNALREHPCSLTLNEEIKNYSFLGHSLQEVYRSARTVLKAQQEILNSVSYKDKCHLVALTSIVSHGAFRYEKATPLGTLDVIGRDRRNAWVHLGSMDSNTAMFTFITKLFSLNENFKGHLETLLKEKSNSINEKEEDKEKGTLAELANHVAHVNLRKSPSDSILDSSLSLSDSQGSQAMHLETEYKQKGETSTTSVDSTENTLVQNLPEECHSENEEDSSENCDCCQNEDKLGEAQMWTEKSIQIFKDSIRKESKGAVIKIGQGETVTVRVPSTSGSSVLCWEFATDNYDIAFGLLFEWSNDENEKNISVHISDSEEDEDDDVEDDEDFYDPSDPERVSGVSLVEKGPPTSMIIPIYRRDCHEEVYAGSHKFPGTGVYLLKFDNTYSLWRSKTLYYRVYYTQ